MTKQPSRRNWLTRMRDGLRKSSNTISTGITAIFKGKAIDRDALSQLEDLLIGADLGVTTAHEWLVAPDPSLATPYHVGVSSVSCGP